MKKIKHSTNQIKSAIDQFKSGINITKISKNLNISRRSLCQLLQEHGLELKTKSELIRDSIPELQDHDYLYDLYINQTKSITEVAEILETNEQVIKTAFRRLKISSADTRKNKFLNQFPDLLDKKYLKDCYIKKKMSSTAIAKILGCSSSAVDNALKGFNIGTRTHEEASKLTQSTSKQKLNSRIARNLRSRFWIALSGKSKMVSAVSDLGMSIAEFKLHFETLFYADKITNEAMTWDNYGKWEIDHVIPLNKYDLSNESEQKKACHYTNLQPLWASDNRAKSDSIIGQKPTYVPFYLVVGPAGCGKSWVCDQLVDVNYISFDSVPKEQHYHYMVELSKNKRPIVYDPFRKVNTIYKRYASMFDIKIVVINESIATVKSRLESRGSTMTESKIAIYVDKFNKFKNATFSGTSQEVLDYLKTELAPPKNT